MFVLDCSVAMTWLFEDEKTEFTERMFDKLGEDGATVPSLWFLEVMNVCLCAEKRKRCTPAQSIRFMEMLKSFCIEVDNGIITQCEPLLLLARSYDLSAYDAAYLDIALRLGYPIATLDTDLKKACKAAGVTVLQ